VAKAVATIRTAVDGVLSSARCANRNTRRSYGDVPDKLADQLGAERRLADVGQDELARGNANAVEARECWGPHAGSPHRLPGRVLYHQSGDNYLSCRCWRVCPGTIWPPLGNKKRMWY